MKKEDFKRELLAIGEAGLVLMFLSGLFCMDSKASREAILSTYTVLAAGAVFCLGVIVYARNK